MAEHDENIEQGASGDTTGEGAVGQQSDPAEAHSASRPDRETQASEPVTDDTESAADQQQDQPLAGTESAGDLFDALPEAERDKHRPKKEESRSQQNKASPNAQKGSVQTKYPEGAEFRYAGHSIYLPREMIEREVFEHVADSFPELESGKNGLRYDKDKNRIVPTEKAQKKG